MNSNEEIIPSYVLDWISKKLVEFDKRLDECDKRLDQFDEHHHTYNQPTYQLYTAPPNGIPITHPPPCPDPDPPYGMQPNWHSTDAFSEPIPITKTAVSVPQSTTLQLWRKAAEISKLQARLPLSAKDGTIDGDDYKASESIANAEVCAEDHESNVGSREISKSPTPSVQGTYHASTCLNVTSSDDKQMHSTADPSAIGTVSKAPAAAKEEKDRSDSNQPAIAKLMDENYAKQRFVQLFTLFYSSPSSHTLTPQTAHGRDRFHNLNLVDEVCFDPGGSVTIQPICSKRPTQAQCCHRPACKIRRPIALVN